MSAGKRAVEGQPLAGDRMDEAEQPRMQGLSREMRQFPRRAAPMRASRGASGARAVGRVADQRMADMREVNPDLVGAAGQQSALDQCGMPDPLGPNRRSTR